MKKFILFLKSRNFDFIVGLSILFIFLLFIVGLIISAYKKTPVDLPLGWNITISIFFLLVAILKIWQLKLKKKDLDMQTALSILFSVVFFFTILK